MSTKILKIIKLPATTATVAVYNVQTSQDPSKRVKMVNFEQEEITCNFTPKITITYSGNPPPNNNALIYTNAKAASDSSNYDSMGNSGSKIVSSDTPNLGIEQVKGKNPLQESQSENYNSTSPSGESSGAITVAN